MAPKTSKAQAQAPNNKISDATLDAGFVSIILQNPITQEDMQSLVPLVSFAHNKPGIVSFATQVMLGKIDKDAHGDKDLQALALSIFADVVKAKGKDFVLDALSTVDDSIKKAQAQAQLHAWRIKLDELDKGQAQAQAKDLQSEYTTAQAKLADIKSRMDAHKASVAKKLGLDALFDLSYTDNGFYVASGTTSTSTGTRNSVDRDISKDQYTKTGKVNGFDVYRECNVLGRDADGQPDTWSVKLVATDGKGKKHTYAASGNKGDTLYAVAKPLTDKMRDDVVDVPQAKSKALHVYSFFGID